MQRLFVIMLLVSVFSCKSKPADTGAPQAEKWELMEKKMYNYVLNKVGNADTAYTATYKYKNGVLTDTAYSFIVYQYNKENTAVTSETAFNIVNARKMTEGLTKKYFFNPNGSQSGFNILYDGKLVRNETSFYNDSNRLIKQVMIVAQIDSNLNKINGTINASLTDASIRYDTVTVTYKYDEAKRLTGVIYTNPRGAIIRNDANIYSGTDPLSSHSIGAKGDTLQKVTYEKDGKVLHTAIENDSVLIVQNTEYGFQTGEMTIYKKRNEKWRSAIAYDPKGRPKQQTLYKAM